MTEFPNNPNPASIACPECQADCSHLTEIRKLREEVNQLQALVRTDELTGLFNFRYFSHAMELEMERTRRSGQPTSLIMFDLDHFKDINDDHGHEAGNAVLTHVAALVRKTLRRLDIPCRYGGEEFTIILPDTSLTDGILLANRLRVIIENSTIASEEKQLKVTASFGVDRYSTGDTRTEKEFIEKVDSFLYQAKEEGRNRVCHSDESDDGYGVSSDEKDALMDMYGSDS